MWRNTKRFLVVFIALWLVAVVGGMAVMNWISQPLNIDSEDYVYELKKGGSLSALVYDLASDDVIDYPKVLLWYARLTKQVNVQAGEYVFQKGDTPLNLLDKVNAGDVKKYTVTLVEGWTFQQAVAHLQQHEKLQTMLVDESAVNRFLSELNLPNNHPEGWFFPDTYQFSAASSDRDILRRAYDKMQNTLATEWEQRLDGLPYQTPYEALIMASIIERETGQPHERSTIAGVFVRRLQRGMRLQTDPTVIYGMGDRYQGNLRRADLREATAYNTYVISGLPPTPIALPGAEAIHAALNPEEGSELYFVGKGDGSHYFSATLEEHNDAVRRFQLNRVDNYRSVPQ